MVNGNIAYTRDDDYDDNPDSNGGSGDEGPGRRTHYTGDGGAGAGEPGDSQSTAIDNGGGKNVTVRRTENNKIEIPKVPGVHAGRQAAENFHSSLCESFCSASAFTDKLEVKFLNECLDFDTVSIAQLRQTRERMESLQTKLLNALTESFKAVDKSFAIEV